jgi:hypothetical protein
MPTRDAIAMMIAPEIGIDLPQDQCYPAMAAC